jgi:hypothetical protein
MPRYLPPVRDTSRYSGGDFVIGDGRRNYSGLTATNSTGSSVSSGSK